MSEYNAPSSIASPQGRRVLVAVVTGERGDCIQRWREAHDPEQARRLPPHTTLCYWAPDLPLDAIGKQVRHAFSEPVEALLGAVRSFANDQGTLYVEVLNTGQLDRARRRLYDGTHAALGEAGDWPWHVTCVRDTRGRDRETLLQHAGRLDASGPWKVERAALLELRGDAYAPLGVWDVGQ